jgi:hypothetical protein
MLFHPPRVGAHEKTGNPVGLPVLLWFQTWVGKQFGTAAGRYVAGAGAGLSGWRRRVAIL